MKGFLENGFLSYKGCNQATETARKGTLRRRTCKEFGLESC